MEMNIGDMVAAMAARNEAFRGNEQVPEKVEAYNKLKEHAAAIGKVLRAPWYADDLELREQNTFFIEIPPQPGPPGSLMRLIYTIMHDYASIFCKI